MSVGTPRSETLVQDLRDLVGDDAVIADADGLERYAADTYWKALAAQASGSPLGLPDVAVLPADEAGVAAVLRFANERGLPVVPRGGGSGSQGGAVPVGGGILLDLTRLDRIVEVDEESLTVTAEAGVNGEVLERALNERGLMLPHYPASVDLATVGGYVAARGSGVLSTRYGKIEDLVLSLRVALADGTVIETVAVPRHAVGPELTQLFVGSEGTLGVVTRATLQLAPLPAARRFEAVSFASVPEGIATVRSMHRPRPAPLRRAHVRRGGHPHVARAGRRAGARGRLHGLLLRGRARRRRRGGGDAARARPRARRRRPRRQARRDVVEAPLRVLQAAAPSAAARHLGDDRGGRSLRPHLRRLPGGEGGGRGAVRRARADAQGPLQPLVPVGDDDVRPLRRPGRRARGNRPPRPHLGGRRRRRCSAPAAS